MEANLDYLALLPEIFLTIAICAVLVIDAFLDDDQRHITYALAQFSLLGTAILTIYGFPSDPIVGFYGQFVRDGMGDVLKIAVYLVTAVGFLYARDYLIERRLMRGEYFVLGLFGVLGMMILISSHNFLSLYLGLELLALSQYALVAFNRDSEQSSEAAMKYFVLGAIASGMLLYGISMMYGATGSLDLKEVSTRIQNFEGDRTVLSFGLAFIVVGLAFKLGAAPFHMWLPDVYQGAITPVTLYLGAAPKIAAFAMAIRLLVDSSGNLVADWQPMLQILAVLSIVIGNLAAIAQTNLKRMLAYSTISHVGFIILGIVSGQPEGYGAAMFYAITYAFTASAAFGLIIVLSHEGYEAEEIADFKGLNQQNPWLALMMLFTMMSMAGIPFLVGFYAKLFVIQSLVNQGMVGLALFAVVFSVIGAFYYLRVVKYIYFDKLDDAKAYTLKPDIQAVISANGLLIIGLGLYPTALLSLCMLAF